MSIYSALFYFFIYAFLGWCLEVVYTRIRRREWINRGFLNGPLCPIYGVGVVLILVIVRWILGNMGLSGMIAAFAVITVVTTLLELITGAVLESLFMTKWWDYSSNRFNYKGYICLKFSLGWGIAGTAVLIGFHPLIERGVQSVSTTATQLILTVLLFAFAIDMSFTVRALIDFRRLLFEFEKITNDYKNAKEKLLNELENIIQDIEPPTGKIKEEIGKINNGVHASKNKLKEEIGKFSDDLGGIRNRLKTHLDALRMSGFLPNGVMRDFLSKRQDLESKLRKPFKTNIHEVYDRFNKLSGKLSRNRFFKAFPDMQSAKFHNQIKAIRERYEVRKNRKK